MLGFGHWLWRVMVQARRRFGADHCTQASSALAFLTALALVPLSAVAFALLKATGQLEARSALLSFVGQQIFPSSAEARGEIVSRLASFSDNIAAGALGSFGLTATIAVSFLLFLSVEELWNHIWASGSRRPFLNRFLRFYAAATLVPFLLGVSLWRTAALWTGAGALNIILPLLSTMATFTLANLLLPVVQVQWRAALWGGVVSALLFELAKFSFSLYLARIIGNYRSIYGALAVLPLFLLWIEVAWLTVLWGAEVAHAVQRLPTLEAAALPPDVDQDEEDFLMDKGPVAVRLLCDVARRFSSGQGALPRSELRVRHHLSEQTSHRILRRLEQRGLILPTETGVVPARPPSDIRIAEILLAFRPARPDDGEAEAVDRVLHEIEQKGQQAAAVTLAELLPASTEIDAD